MKRSRLSSGQIALLALFIFAIWPSIVLAAAPVITSLGQRTEGLYRPTRIDVDGQANLYIADPRLRTIQKWDMYGRAVATYSGFPVQGGLAITPDGSRLYVCGTTSVAIVDPQTGEVVGALGQGEGEFGYAFDIDLDAQGNVYVADGYQLTVRVYNPEGEFQYAFGGKGVTNGTFNSISVLAVHPGRGEVYVADSSFPDPYLPKVQVFSLTGTWLRTLGSTTSFGTALYSFGAITFDDFGRGYFFNQSKSWMSVLDLPTTYRVKYGVEGSSPGQLLAPRDAAWDPVNKRLVVLCADSRLEYFGIDGGTTPVNRNVAPGVPAPVSPVGGIEVASATPALTFANAVDADGDLLTYNVRLAKDGQTVADYTGIAQGAGQTVAQVAQTLTEDATYSWSVQAFDGKLASAWSAPQSFKVNAVQAPPTVPVPVTPVGGADVASATPALVFANASDPDSTVLTYNVRLQANGQTVADYTGLAQGAGPTSVQVTQALTEDATYAWSVQAFDGKLASAWSAPQSFRINAVQEPPTVPVPVSPVAGGEVASATPALLFANAVDPDSAVITYNVRLLGNGGETLAEYTGLPQGAGQTAAQVAQTLVENATYAWSVQASDGLLLSAWSAPQSFKVNAVEEAPGNPATLEPATGSILASATPVFTFTTASDPDGDAVTYALRLQQDGQTVAEYRGIGQGAFQPVEPLTENATYRWSVQATDGVLVSAWSAPQDFIVNARQDAPSAPALVAPVDGAAIDGNGELSWGEAVDPDPAASVRYRLQISDAPEFTAVAVEEELAGTNLLLGDCAGYPELTEGSTYYWRVLAVDNDGLLSEGGAAGRFVYDTTVLAVTANVPGTRIYLGGHHAYAGQYLGETPLEVRDLAPGTYRVAAERAGLESFVGQITVGERQNVKLDATLVAALAPDLTARVPLSAGGQKIVIDGHAAPFVIDLDGDLVLDLIVANASGALTFYRGLPTADRELPLAVGVSLGQFLPGAIPFIVDWNNDGRLDLLLGEQQGTVALYLDQNASGLPRYNPAQGQPLTVSGVPIDVGYYAAPAVIDFDEDGDKDLVVGNGNGLLNLYANTGSDEAPVLSPAIKIDQLPTPASYFFSDWNADGRRDLLSVSGAVIAVALRSDGNTFAAAQVVADLSKNGQIKMLRPFACDFDNVKGKDLFVGAADGQIYLAKGNGKDPLPALQSAVQAKIAELEELAAAGSLASEIAGLRSAAQAGDYKKIRQQVDLLLATAAGDLASGLEGLGRLLK